MKILILADTHGSLPAVLRALELSGPVDRILHLGDVLYHGPRNPLPAGYGPADLAVFLAARDDVTYVRGNCDSEVDRLVLGQPAMPQGRFLSLNGRGFWLEHGHASDEKARLQRARRAEARVLASGHTHLERLERVNGLVVLNPGSTTLPKGREASFALLDGDWLHLRSLESGRYLISLELQGA